MTVLNYGIIKKSAALGKDVAELKKSYEERSVYAAMCSAMTWECEDGEKLWGRTYDFHEIADDAQIAFFPAGTYFYSRGTKQEGTLCEKERITSRYAMLGAASLIDQETPVLYEGMNECGLCGGQLYFRQFAGYGKRQEGKLPLQPVYALTYFLSQCSGLEELICHLKEKVVLLQEDILGQKAPVHWLFSDRSGEAIVVEAQKDGLHIYRNSMGILTNSPAYPWHLQHLLLYGGIQNEDRAERTLHGTALTDCFSGSGAIGLPGDCSSPSRFVRLTFLKQYAKKGRGEQEGIVRMFRLLEQVAFPLGLVKLFPAKHKPDAQLYDHTIYTAVMCVDTLCYYWNTYDNPSIRFIDMKELLKKGQRRCFSLKEPFCARQAKV